MEVSERVSWLVITSSNIVGGRLRVSLRSKIFADLSLQDFAVNAIAINEKLVQGILPLLGRSWSFSLGGRDRFLAASSVSSSTITIVSRITVTTGHNRATGVFLRSTPGLAQKREHDGKEKRNLANLRTLRLAGNCWAARVQSWALLSLQRVGQLAPFSQ